VKNKNITESNKRTRKERDILGGGQNTEQRSDNREK
jgi:hypothetical protein